MNANIESGSQREIKSEKNVGDARERQTKECCYAGVFVWVSVCVCVGGVGGGAERRFCQDLSIV